MHMAVNQLNACFYLHGISVARRYESVKRILYSIKQSASCILKRRLSVTVTSLVRSIYDKKYMHVFSFISSPNTYSPRFTKWKLHKCTICIIAHLFNPSKPQGTVRYPSKHFLLFAYELADGNKPLYTLMRHIEKINNAKSLG